MKSIKPLRLIFLAAVFAIAVAPMKTAIAATPLQVAQEAYLKASQGLPAYRFGYSVAMSGNTVIVGAGPFDYNNVVYVFVRDGANWVEQARLQTTLPGAFLFGLSVAISGDTVVVGAQGDHSNATGINGEEDNAGASYSGAAFVFVREGTTWRQQAYLKASNTRALARFGSAVSISGDTIVVGSYSEASNATGVNGAQNNQNASFSGAAYIFVRRGTVWTQEAYLKASNTRAGARFGDSVGVSGDIVIIGSPYEGSNATGVNGDQSGRSAPASGAAYVFTRRGTDWTQQAYLKASSVTAGDQFGYVVGISGNTIIIGAPREDANREIDSGAAYVFVQSGATWVQQAELHSNNSTETDRFGESVSISGDVAIVGASFQSGAFGDVNGRNESSNLGGFNSGAAYLFERTGTTWRAGPYLKASNSGVNDQFGFAVAISGNNAVVGAMGESSGAFQVNGDQCDNSAPLTGAAYLYDLDAVNFGVSEIVVEQPAGNLLVDGSASVDFGSALIGAAGTTRVFTVRNQGTAPLGGRGWTVTGVSSTDFEVTLNSHVVSWPCDSTTFAVTFQPKASGLRTAQLHLVSNDSDESPFDIVLTGSGVLPTPMTPAVTQQAYLKGPNPRQGDRFGKAVAVSDGFMVIGTPDDNNQEGAAYVFVRDGTGWSPQARLTVPDAQSEQFGWAVAVSGNTIVVGMPFDSSEATGVNGEEDGFGASGSGAAYVFVWDGTSWTRQAYLKASNTGPNDGFGRSVAISGETVVIGSYREDSNATGADGNQANNAASDAGAAYVFVRAGTLWSQQAYLKPSDTQAGDQFGAAVAIAGDTLVIGAPREGSNFRGVQNTQTRTVEQSDTSAAASGAAYVFVRGGTTWNQQAYLKPLNSGAGDEFGISVAVSDHTVVVGAWNEDSAGGVNSDGANDNAPSSGAAYVFVRDGVAWSQQALLKASNLSPNELIGDFFGESVSVSGDTIVVGASREDSNATGVNGDGANNNAQASGAAYVYRRSGSPAIWSEQAYLKASNTRTFDLFGSSVAISGDTAVIGAYQEASVALESGAAYVFRVGGGAGAPSAPEYIISTFAGTRVPGFALDGNPANQTRLFEPRGLAVDSAGNVYIADSYANLVYRVDANGMVSTFAGTGSPSGGDGGPAISAALIHPWELTVDPAGHVYISEEANRVRKVDPNGVITTFAGTGSHGFSGDGGPAIAAELDGPQGLASDGTGGIYIADRLNNRVRVVRNGIISTFAGTGVGGFSGDGGLATQAKISHPLDVAVDAAGNVFIAESARIRRVSAADGIITTIAGQDTFGFRGDGGLATQAWLNYPSGLAVDSAGNVYFADQSNRRVRRVDTRGIIATIAGSNRSGASPDGIPALAESVSVFNLALDPAGRIYLATGTHTVRLLTPSGGIVPLIPSYVSTPLPGTLIGFPDLPPGSQRIERLFIGNRGTADLRLESAGFPVTPRGLTLAVMDHQGNSQGIPSITVSLPQIVPSGGQLEVRLIWDFENEGEQNAELRVVSNDPDMAVATYQVHAAPFIPFGVSFEEVVIRLLNTGSTQHSQNRSHAMASANLETAVLALDPSAPRLLTAEIPAFLGGGSVQLSNFTGSATVSLHAIPNDQLRKLIRVESGSFTAPSFRLPGGLETGPNQLTFGPPEQSSGILSLTNGSYTASANATIINQLIPSGVTVWGNYSGVYDPETRQISLTSQSQDLFQPRTQLLYILSADGFRLTWAATNVLEEATNVAGPWNPLANALSPYSIVTTNHQQYFRLRPN